jgi:hypothetical protein
LRGLALLKSRPVRNQKAELFGINRQRVFATEVGFVEIGQRNVKREIVESKSHCLGSDELDVDAHPRITIAKSFQHPR